MLGFVFLFSYKIVDNFYILTVNEYTGAKYTMKPE